ncbi:MAG: SAM-dependent methyltransferase [Gammaproteobacteria bacterium]|nr:SAM-dependent methyltransferase [Gammaproteobacteria bacterium]
MTPPLSAEEAAHSEALAAHIAAAVRAGGGWLSFERFMALALYAPGLGYYSAGSIKIGAGGDFVTAPQMSDLFSRCVAAQCAEVLADGGEILEFGAGTGRMAAAVLTELDARGCLPQRYAILEVSADLAQRQRRCIGALPATLAERVVWLDRLPERPVQGVILANEVLDALPCRRFVLEAGAPRELGVALEGTRLVERAAPADAALTEEWARLSAELPAPLTDGYVSEICLQAGPWVGSAADALQRGMMLLFDYGLPRAHYYHPQRVAGTLRCHYKHRVHDDPYVNLGVQDLTAWVDFTRIAESAVAAGLDVAGFATQAAFLLGTGIERLVAEAGDALEHARRAGEARRLLLPGEMGEAFKVMALTRQCDAPLPGFALQDLRASL